ncbi:MAG TPA: patatin-like phospholipase family protein [Patescibacteria group bacterium]|nr:patatin-like phospholipase family protein [Patescibacteria group bacterium]
MPSLATVPRFTLGQQLMNLVGILKYGIFFSVLLVFLPLTARDGVLLHGLLGGLFVDLTAWAIFFVSLGLLGTAWSLMFTEGLIVVGVERWHDGGAAYRPFETVESSPTQYVPAWAEKFFCVPITGAQFVFYTLLAVPGLWIIVQYSAAGWLGALGAAGAGFVVGYFLLIMLSAPAALIDATHPPMTGLPLVEPFWACLRKVPLAVKAAQLFRSWVSIVFRFLGMTAFLQEAEDGRRRLIYPSHFIAVTNVIGLVVLATVVAVVFEPARPATTLATGPADSESSRSLPSPPVTGQTEATSPAPPTGSLTWFGVSFPSELPAVLYLLVIVIGLVLAFTTVQSILGPYRVSPVLALLVIMLLGYRWSGTDHYFPVGAQTPRDRAALTPVAVAKAGPPGRRNLVVVVASGGGILAAGWTTLALEKLVASRPQLQEEIRLLSGISGGAVGAAFYLDGALRRETPADARVKSMSSSLAATAYGFAFRDFFRLLTGGVVPLDLDRGLLLERQWLKTANGVVNGDEVRMPQGVLIDRTMASLRSQIAQGRIPAPILSATIMESGRRVMMTPVDFERPRRARRAMTMSEFLFEERRRRAGEALVAVNEYPELDLPLWTAARLSATFAFVTPAARADLFDDASTGTRPTDHRGHHIIDGGYYDNFGVTSALDWLDPVLAARLNGRDLDFDRVVIIQLRAFRRANPRDVPPKSGAVAALLGPLIGLEAIRDGAAVSRNDIELNRFATSWTARLRQPVNGRPVDVCVFTLQPKRGAEGPMSWHLTAKDKKQLAASWVEEEAQQVTDYLATGGRCPGANQ